ncbi:WecB/TagA/CpsF family glycosyltransferase [Phreatobacter sp.]|uniref:WecB/TagA/CpsF family glycosyltransferase n=1 Tax=Phreatobacter sp. TaxID=1966341 RepID=UPI0022C14945|nr:WecB/TagA/CpsF family glycosyltransferase [Phreatobacter sp.]MCZ8314722.1 WecB/TagA/CpsF family glycosyltransferase [Phreatobacter sp.]
MAITGTAPSAPSPIAATEAFDEAFAAIPTVTVGGLPIAVLDRAATADWMIRAARERPRGRRPLYLTSANGEVIARASSDPELAGLIGMADQIVADGQPLVLASRYRCRMALPERVATTDLFHDVARRAEDGGTTFYLLGATPEEVEKAVANVRAAYPRLRLVGHHHGFLKGEALEAKVAEIDALAPDILWLAMGVPHEQRFVARFAHRLTHVGMIKTSGGLFNFLSGTNRRAPDWMQRASLEWAFRIWLEPRRLFWRYAVTNPKAIWLMATRSS